MSEQGSAWLWLKAELARQLGEAPAAQIWAEYRRRAGDDVRRAKLRDRRRQYKAHGRDRDLVWLVDHGDQAWLIAHGYLAERTPDGKAEHH